MANPKIKNGYLPIANELVEKFAHLYLSPNEWRIIWATWRKTWCWTKGDRRKDFDWISLTQYEKLTGLRRSPLCRSLKKLVTKQLLLKTKNGYGFNQNYEQWVVTVALPPVTKPLLKGVTLPAIRGVTVALHTKETVTKERIKESRLPLVNRRKTIRFPKGEYDAVISKYQELKGISLQGNEFQPIQQTIKTMFLAGRTVKQIIDCMAFIADLGDQSEAYSQWTIRTIKLKLPEFLSGKLKIK